MQLTSTWCGCQYLQKSSRIWLRKFSAALEEELKVLDFVQRFNCCYIVWLNCFHLFQHLLTSLIRFALWDSGKALEATVLLQTSGRGRAEVPTGPHSIPISSSSQSVLLYSH